MFARGVRARGQAHCGGWHLTTQAAATRAQEAAAHWLGPRYSARTAYFGKWRTYLRRVARRLSAGCVPGCAVQVQWARDHGSQAGGLAGGRAHRCKCPKTKTSRRSCAASATRSDAKPQAGLLPPPQGANAARAGGGSAAPFLHDEAGPLLAVLLHVHLLIVRHSPRWKLPRCETPASGALRVGSGSRSFCARTAALREVCRDGTRPRARGSGSTRAVQTSGSTRSIYTSAMCGSGHDTGHSLHPPHPGAACSLSWGRPRWAQPWAQPTRVCVARAFRAPPPTRNA